MIITDLQIIIKNLNKEYDEIYQSLNHKNEDRALQTKMYLNNLEDIRDDITTLTKYLPLSLDDYSIQQEAIYNLKHIEEHIFNRMKLYERFTKKRIYRDEYDNPYIDGDDRNDGGISKMTWHLRNLLIDCLDTIQNTKFLPLE